MPKQIELTCHCCERAFLRRSLHNHYCVDCSIRMQRVGALVVVKVQREIRFGRLKPATAYSCVDCGAPAKVYDHRDYTKPLEVVPLCVRCNVKRPPAGPKWKFKEYRPIDIGTNFIWPDPWRAVDARKRSKNANQAPHKRADTLSKQAI